jgi:hypothetical protein
MSSILLGNQPLDLGDDTRPVDRQNMLAEDHPSSDSSALVVLVRISPKVRR